MRVSCQVALEPVCVASSFSLGVFEEKRKSGSYSWGNGQHRQTQLQQCSSDFFFFKVNQIYAIKQGFCFIWVILQFQEDLCQQHIT